MSETDVLVECQNCGEWYRGGGPYAGHACPHSDEGIGRDQRFVVYLPITPAQADCIGMPAEWFERAVRRLGVEHPAPEKATSDENISPQIYPRGRGYPFDF